MMSNVPPTNLSASVPFPATGMPDPGWWHALWSDPVETLRKIGIRPAMDVIDLCCGDGHFTAPLCALVDDGSVLGVDLDDRLLDAATAACAGRENFTPILADARDLEEVIPSPVDFVLIANTFHGVPDKTELARVVHRVLKPGGRFAVVNWYPRPREETTVLGKARGPATELRMAPREVAVLVEPAGFRQVDVIDLEPYHYGAVFER